MSSATKLCVVCKKDCSNQPRVKDSRGRYFHRSCYDAAKRRQQEAKTKAAQAEPAPDPVPLAELVDHGLSSMDDFAAPSADACPSCGGPMAPEAILCTGCAYPRQGLQCFLHRRWSTNGSSHAGDRQFDDLDRLDRLLFLLLGRKRTAHTRQHDRGE